MSQYSRARGHVSTCAEAQAYGGSEWFVSAILALSYSPTVDEAEVVAALVTHTYTMPINNYYNQHQTRISTQHTLTRTIIVIYTNLKSLN